MRKFSKMVQESGKLRIVKEKQEFTSKVEERKKAKKSAKARWKKYQQASDVRNGK
jgi:ribosomal protein S21